MKNRGISTEKLVGMAILLAMVVVLQLYGSGIKIGTVSLSLTLIPIVLGGAVFGPFCGALLGFVFGAVTFAGRLKRGGPVYAGFNFGAPGRHGADCVRQGDAGGAWRGAYI